MISITPLPVIRKIADRFKTAFSTNGQEISYTSICATIGMHIHGHRNISDSVRKNPWAPSVSCISENIQKFNSNRFMRRLRSSILGKSNGTLNTNDYCYAIDDTANSKYGNNMFRVNKWGGRSGVYNGQKILVLALINKKSGHAIPIHYFVCNKKDDDDYVSGHNACINLLLDVFKQGFPKLPVVFDSWFDSAPLMSKLDENNIIFCIQAKEKRVIKANPSPRGKYVPWKNIFKNKLRTGVRLVKTEHQKKTLKTKYVSEARVFIKKRPKPLKAIAVYNKNNYGNFFGIYLTNDLNMPASFLYELSRRRWLLEELFRNLKQHLSFGKLPCSGKAGTDVSICIPFAIVISLQLFPEEWDQSDLCNKTIGEKIEKERTINKHKGLHLIINNPTHEKVKIFKSRSHISRIYKKPINSAADEPLCA